MASIDFSGNVGSDPEVQFTSAGRALVKFSVAETERIKDQQTGEWSDGDTTWWRCTAWGPFGEKIAESVTRGQGVHVRGRVKIREYDKDGEKRLATEVTVDKLGLDVGRIKPKGESRSFDDSNPPF